MNKLIAVLMLCVSLQAQALEVEGVKLDDKIQLANETLQLNGSGVRSIFILKIYVAALYLGAKKTTAEAVFADPGAKRIALHVVAGETSSERFVHGFRKGIENNYDEKGVAGLRERMDAFEHILDPVKTVKNGDVIAFDWLPGAATRVEINGKELGRINGEDFYHALLSIWIGEKPVMDSMKKGLLGG